MPIRTDISLWRGNNAPPLVWSLPEGVPTTGSVFVLTISIDDDTRITRDTAAGTLELDLPHSELRWAFTTAESRQIPLGEVAGYEIERRTDGVEITEFYGTVTGLGGLNGDTTPGGDDPVGGLDFSSADNSSLQLLGWI